LSPRFHWAAHTISSPSTPEAGPIHNQSLSDTADHPGWFVETVGVTRSPEDNGVHDDFAGFTFASS
jgi:hypothetical protein